MTLFTFHSEHGLARGLAQALDIPLSPMTVHRFPDGESCVRIETEAVTDTCLVYACLAQPDPVTLPLLFLARTLRDAGAKKLVLVAPYLAYMRQDKRFHPGEGITARYYAELLSEYFDALVTVDPHLHRVHNLQEIYSMQTCVVESATTVAGWIRNNIDSPLIIGPDSESEQWAKRLAQLTGTAYVILQKTRHSDREVEISVPDIEQWQQHTPILFDDIISTGSTMIVTVGQLLEKGMRPPMCIGVHAVFAGDGYLQLLGSGAAQVVTCNTIHHDSNAIDLSSAVADAVRQLA